MTKLKEMLDISKKGLNDLTKKEISYIIVTGGIVNMPGFDVLAKEVFSDNVIVRPITTIGVRDNSYSQAIGMIKYFIEKLKIRGKEYTMFDEDKQVELVENRKNNTSNSNSVFGRFFGYLFDSKEE
jgi:cell division ATPase FtsA